MGSNREGLFANQVFYLGIDVDRKRWSVTIRNSSLTLKRFSMNPSPEQLHSYMHRNYPGGRYHVAYEAGFCGFWIYRTLTKLGFDCTVINPSDVPSSDKERQSKSDPIDSRKLARELENGSLECIYVPNQRDQHFRSLCRLYYSCVQNSTRTKNRIKGHIYYNGISLPKHTSQWSGAFIDYLENIPLDNGPGRDCLLLLIEELRQHRQRKKIIIDKLRRYVQEFGLPKLLKNLQSIPGIGFKTGVTLYAEIIDMRRFPTLDRLKSYVGLAPSVASSGEREIVKGITRRRNRYLRYVLIEAAWVAVRKDPALLACYNKLISRMKKQDAIVRIAKKLLSRIRYVWLNDTEYIPGIC